MSEADRFPIMAYNSPLREAIVLKNIAIRLKMEKEV